MDSTTGLPDRAELVVTLEEMLAEDERPSLFVVAVTGFAELSAAGPVEAAAAMREVARLLGRLVRATDVLAVLGGGVFALASPGVEHSDLDVLLERVRGVFALPVQVGPHAVSLPVTVGTALPVAGSTAHSMIGEAEADLRRRLAEA